MSAAAEAATPQERYRAALDARRLTFQRCTECGNAWLPARSECPRCWSPEHDWVEAAGTGRVVSWVVFHVAFDARFKGRTPYNAALIELDEGPRLVSNITSLPKGEEIIGRRVGLVFEHDLERHLPRFALRDGADELT